MAEGLDNVYSGRGRGYVHYVITYSGEALGSGSGASKKTVVKLPVPQIEGSSVELAYLSIGVGAVPGASIPFRWRVGMNGSTITRVMKPQFTGSMDDRLYLKAIYDVTPILTSKPLLKTALLSFFYDSFQPLIVMDASLFLVIDIPESYHSTVLFSGSAILEPGESLRLYARLGGHFGGERSAHASVMLPSPKSRVEFIAGGSQALVVEGPGHREMRVDVPYRGGEVPIALRYLKPGESFYPKRLVIGEVIVSEQRSRSPRLEIRVEEVRVSGGLLAGELTIKNLGGERASKVRAWAKALGLVVWESLIDSIEPGEEVRVRFGIELSKLPKTFQPILFNVEWKALGVSFRRSVEARPPYA